MQKARKVAVAVRVTEEEDEFFPLATLEKVPVRWNPLSKARDVVCRPALWAGDGGFQVSLKARAVHLSVAAVYGAELQDQQLWSLSRFL